MVSVNCPSIAQRQLRQDNFRGGTVSGKLGGGEFLSCLTAHPFSLRVNVNRQGEGLSCRGESIITEEGPDPTKFLVWVEGVGEPGNRGMWKLPPVARVCLPVTAPPLAASVTVLPPPDGHVPALPVGFVAG